MLAFIIRQSGESKNEGDDFFVFAAGCVVNRCYSVGSGRVESVVGVVLYVAEVQLPRSGRVKKEKGVAHCATPSEHGGPARA